MRKILLAGLSAAALCLTAQAASATVFTYTLEFSGSGTRQEIFPTDQVVNSTLNAATIRFQLSDADTQRSATGTANGNGMFLLTALGTGFNIALGSGGGFLFGDGAVRFSNVNAFLPGSTPMPVSGNINFRTFETGNETSQTFSGQLTSFAVSQMAGTTDNFASITTTVGPVAAVPEVSTWAMMLVGFGLIGATARYRRRVTRVAYA